MSRLLSPRPRKMSDDMWRTRSDFVKPMGPAECSLSGPEARTLPKVRACLWCCQRQVAFDFDDVDALGSEDTHHLGWGSAISMAPS